MLKEEITSSIVATENLLLSRAINAKENYNIMNLDFPNAFAQRVMLKSINARQAMLKIHEALVDVLHQIAPEAH